MDTATPVFLHGYSGDGQSLEEFAAVCFPDKQPVCIDLPGFGATLLSDKAAETNAEKYLEEVWAAVRRAVPEGNIHLVGHSYGAVLAFALAAAHKDVVSRIDLFTPGVFPRLAPRVGLRIIRALDFIPGGLRPFTWLMRRQPVVDMVTRSMEHKSWPEQRKRQIRAMRHKESQTYSVQMFRLSLHALRMPRMLEPARCTVPVRVVYSTDDTVALYSSCQWLEQRSSDITMVATYGGHLGLVADPTRWAQLLYKD